MTWDNLIAFIHAPVPIGFVPLIVLIPLWVVLSELNKIKKLINSKKDKD